MPEEIKHAELATQILDIKTRSAEVMPDANGKRQVEITDADIACLKNVGDLLNKLDGVLDLDLLCLNQLQLQAVMLAFGTLIARAADGKLGPPGPVIGHGVVK